MSNSIKNRQDILDKLRIEKLNDMQEEAGKVLKSEDNLVLLSPTGTGKTIAFLLPIIDRLSVDVKDVQVLILVPSRELALQIEQVIREMGTGYKTNAIYGGRSGAKDKIDLQHPPAILVGTPGRIADHIRRETFSTQNIDTLVLDEFDKSLEVGFEEEMREIIVGLPGIKKRILTSATQGVQIPAFVKLKNPTHLNYLSKKVEGLSVKKLQSDTKDKYELLLEALSYSENKPTIIFCNFKDTIQQVSDFLSEHGINHGCFYGGMEQKDRERALIKFRNGTHNILIATDLAARGIDVPEIKFILHFQVPHRSEEFTHRNGRTARMNANGTAYVLQSGAEKLPDFVQEVEIEKRADLKEEGRAVSENPNWQTLFISGGRKDKISKGDIAGLFFKQGKLDKTQLGIIEVKQDCAFVAVNFEQADQLIQKLNNTRLKKKKVRISLI